MLRMHKNYPQKYFPHILSVLLAQSINNTRYNETEFFHNETPETVLIGGPKAENTSSLTDFKIILDVDENDIDDTDFDDFIENLCDTDVPEILYTERAKNKEDCKKDEEETEDEDTIKAATTLINYPYSVSIQRKGAHYANGALVDKRWILSCAGEFYNTRESVKLLRARLGSVDCKKGGTYVPIKHLEIHPSYVYGEPNFDFALLRLAQPVDFTDYIRPIGFSKITTKVLSAKFLTTYWARLIVHGKVMPQKAQERIKQNSMRVSTQRLIPRSQCRKLAVLRNVTLSEATMCLKPFVTHHSPCTPDAGAPVVAEDRLWGITSGWTSKNCIKQHSPTLFGRISSPSVRAWLDAQMINNNNVI